MTIGELLRNADSLRNHASTALVFGDSFWTVFLFVVRTGISVDFCFLGEFDRLAMVCAFLFCGGKISATMNRPKGESV